MSDKEKKESTPKQEPTEVKPAPPPLAGFGEPTLTDCLRYVDLQMRMADRGMLPEPAAKEVDRMLLAAQQRLMKL